MTATISPADVEQFTQEWRDWHAQHEARIGDQHGFLAVTSMNWLTETPQRFPDAPGAWSSDAAGVHVTLAEGETILVDDQPVSGSHDFGSIAERGGVNARWQDGDKEVVLELAHRGGFDILRPRHPDAPLVTAYRGTPAYEPRPEWAVTGRFVPFATPRATEVGSAVEGINHVYEAPGRVEFEIAGQPMALTVFGSGQGTGYNVLFTDETSGATTWPANRSLHLGLPAEDGTLVVDFNRATNLPCAYTDLATCPLPPAENRLPVAVEAGEKIPYGRSTHA
ncbi:MAG: DUF1684 domain-containing protein [Thermomicrobiales bacterium]